MIDSHAHLCSDELFPVLDEKLEAARLVGVRNFLTVSSNWDSVSKNVAIAEKYDNIVCSVGVHPLHAREPYDVDELISLCTNEKVVAVGEVGLEYHYVDLMPKAEQLRCLQGMLSVAQKSGLPCILHARECCDDILGLLREYAIKHAVFHCYTDTLNNAKKILDAGFFISFSGIITFKNAGALSEVVKYVPDDRFLVETDCPDLAPVPYRGKVNEPAYVSVVAEHVAALRNVSLEAVDEMTTRNFFSLFPKAAILMKKEMPNA
ncbi:MAG: TatD family hydrolase [Alphaproteobacteria bacterium]|nr:TatD family hydrolase [Alphaproteobacteria bacterium]